MDKKKIHILHLYHDLMNLYGDWANVAALEREFIIRGYDVVVEKRSIGDVFDFDRCDFIYIGSGTERSQLACMRDLVKYKDVFIGKIEAETPVLLTGNSHELFGQAVTDPNGNRHELLGLLEFETVQESTRITGDCVGKATFLNDRLIGFINRAGGCQSGEIERPFYIEPGEGASYKASTEGIRYKNLLGTYMTGPVLVRNPPLMMYFADLIEKQSGDPYTTETGKHEDDPFFTFQEKAYSTALKIVKPPSH